MSSLQLKELVSHLDTFLSVSAFPDYCPNGLQVEGHPRIQKIGVAVSASVQAIKEAIERKVDVLIVHHGIFWKNDAYPVVGTLKEKLKLLLDHGISLLAYHLPLDGHPEIGNNWKAARDLGWENLEPFGTIGVKGTFAPKTMKSFQSELETYYGHQAFVAGGKKTIASAALISGGAYKELSNAAGSGVDAFITGNFDEPAWWIAQEENIAFFALGHTATERIGVRELGLHLRQRFGITTDFIDLPNPF